MSIPVGVPNQVRLLLKEYLAAFEELEDITILEAKPKQIGPQIDEALEKKLGLCVVIAPAKVGTSRPNISGPYCDRTLYMVRVYENPELDSNPSEAFDIAWFISAHCHFHYLDEARDIRMWCDSDTITLGDDVGNEENPCISWDVPIWVNIPPETELEQVATPVIVYAADGRVQMSCSTPGAQIFWSREGEPIHNGSNVYTGILEDVVNPETIIAKAYLMGLLPSEIATAQEGEIEEVTVTLEQMNAALAAENSPFRWSSTGVPMIRGTDGKWSPIIVTVSPSPDLDRNLITEKPAYENVP